VCKDCRSLSDAVWKQVAQYATAKAVNEELRDLIEERVDLLQVSANIILDPLDLSPQ
jgi:hypothetical protein